MQHKLPRHCSVDTYIQETLKIDVLENNIYLKELLNVITKKYFHKLRKNIDCFLGLNKKE